MSGNGETAFAFKNSEGSVLPQPSTSSTEMSPAQMSMYSTKIGGKRKNKKAKKDMIPLMTGCGTKKKNSRKSRKTRKTKSLLHTLKQFFTRK
jgi:hypothetical protein